MKLDEICIISISDLLIIFKWEYIVFSFLFLFQGVEHVEKRNPRKTKQKEDSDVEKMEVPEEEKIVATSTKDEGAPVKQEKDVIFEADVSDDEIVLKTPPFAKKKLVRITPSSPAVRLGDTKAEVGSVKKTLKKELATVTTADDSPKLNKNTPKLNKDTPKLKNTPKSNKNTPKSSKDTPKLNKDTPKSNKNTPKLNKNTPKSNKDTPKLNKNTPKLAITPKKPKLE